MANNRDFREMFFLTIPEELCNSIIHALEGTLEQPFECTCDAYMERDTGAWIHDEKKCWAFMEDHIEITLNQLKKAWEAQRKESQDGFTQEVL